ncbi:outer membrane protein assembly factor BamA [Candidatus Pelagibacter sp. RS40]|uniref:outer membrane protein assembly factor BamA n=1 Tax=Candidatus Pelagibacter sp. RS40 TaxID=1977865 RepID=UPI000A1679E1|nr:outer membrane protein assembly factor BamA [Candidatus Pelagibacter sp. RS40]ARJ48503.1 outer membrane protein assembly factor BamA [Candidatus Pelagibacter sp. RS40]
MKKFSNKIKFLVFFTLLNLSFGSTHAEILKKIEIFGNERLADETIILFSNLTIGDDIDTNIINNTFKNLFKTDYFKDLKINFKNGVLEISVKENPIIQEIKINGIKNKSILKQLEKITRKSEKYPFINSKIINQKNQLNNIVRINGFYFADIQTQIIDNNNNSINLIYNFNLGERAKINEIKFIGDKIFNTRKLIKIILSEETRPWKFITKNKFMDPNRISTDIKLLELFYKNKGYFNVKIKSSYALVKNNRDFKLIFSIDTGKKYFFKDFNLNISNDYINHNFLDLNKTFSDLKGKQYSIKAINDIKKKIDKIALQKEFIFIDAKYEEKIVNENEIIINFNIEQLEKSYVDKINIFGNFITEEKVIRNSLIVDEGDPYNKILFNKSISNIKSKGIFKSVKSEISKSKNKKNKIINLIVEEKPTGEIFAGIGTGTGGSSFSVGLKEKNYLGKGITLDTNFALSDDEVRGKFSVINPNFKNSDRLLKTTIESTTSDFMNSSGYKTTRTGLSLGTGFEQYEDIFINLDVSNYYEKLVTSDKATEIKKKQEGDYFENLFVYSITLNKLNQNFQPTDGFFTKFSQSVPIYSDDNSFENTLTASKYHSITDNFLIAGKLYLKAVNSIDGDVRVSKRVYIPSSRLRGFESGKIGPKDGTQYIGGNYGAAFNFTSSFPKFFNEFENLDLNLFVDAANLWHVDYDDSLDSDKIRSSTGVAVDWFTAIGPLSFSYAIPITDANSDETESFRFQIGTSF